MTRHSIIRGCHATRATKLSEMLEARNGRLRRHAHLEEMETAHKPQRAIRQLPVLWRRALEGVRLCASASGATPAVPLPDVQSDLYPAAETRVQGEVRTAMANVLDDIFDDDCEADLNANPEMRHARTAFQKRFYGDVTMFGMVNEVAR